MKENELYRALDASVTGCQPSDYWKNRMVRQIVKGEEMKKRTKVSFGVVIAVALLLISVAAVAVGVLVHEYYAKVADMEKEGRVLGTARAVIILTQLITLIMTGRASSEAELNFLTVLQFVTSIIGIIYEKKDVEII